MKKWLILILFAAALGGAAYYFLGTSRAPALSDKNLTFAEVRLATIRDVVSATGLVEPREVVVVASESPGTVRRLSGRIGQTVLEGEELAQLDDRRIVLKIEEAKNAIQMADAAYSQAQSLLAQANAQEKAAQSQLKYQEDVRATGVLRVDLESAKAQMLAAAAGVKVANAGVEAALAKQSAARTALREAELAHEFTRIKVPGFSLNQTKRQFLILDRKLYEGQMVGPQAGPLFTLAGSLDVVEVHAQVTEGDVNRIHQGMSAEFTITGFDDEDVKFVGTVKQIRPQATAMPQTGTMKGAVYYDTVIEVKNRKHSRTSDWLLRPGMTASVDIIRREHKDVWRVPVTALNFTLEAAYQSDAAKARVAEWKNRPDSANWRTLWTWDHATKQIQPVFVRVDGQRADGAPGLKDAEGNEILEWAPGQEPTQPFSVIIGAPPARTPGFFDQPQSVKI